MIYTYWCILKTLDEWYTHRTFCDLISPFTSHSSFYEEAPSRRKGSIHISEDMHAHAHRHMHTFTYCSNFHKHGLLVSSESGVVLQLPHSWRLVFHYCWISDWDSVCCFKMTTHALIAWAIWQKHLNKFLANYKSYVKVWFKGWLATQLSREPNWLWFRWSIWSESNTFESKC